MIVNVCPAAVTSASPERVWNVIVNLERAEEWMDVKVDSSQPPGVMTPGQIIKLGGPVLGLKLYLSMEVGEMDPQRGWIDLLVRLPFGIDNHEHLTLTPTDAGGTLIRFN